MNEIANGSAAKPLPSAGAAPAPATTQSTSGTKSDGAIGKANSGQAQPAGSKASGAPAARSQSNADTLVVGSSAPTTTAAVANVVPNLRRPKDPLKRGAMFGPRYSQGTIFSPLTTGSAVQDPIPSQPFAGFTTAERNTFNHVVGNSSDTAADVNRVVGMLDTPEAVAAFIGSYFTWNDNHSSNDQTYSPLQMLQSGLGVCRDQHQFATYVLRQHGIEAHTVGYGAPGVDHAITTFNDGSGWGVIEYGQVHRIGAKTEEEALATVIPGALKFWAYEDPTSATDAPGIPYRTYETQAGLQLKSFMHVGDGFLHTALSSVAGSDVPGANGAWTAHVNASLSGTTMSAGKGPLSVDLRMWNGRDPMLSQAFGAALRYRPGPHVAFSLGAARLPNAYSYSVGPRQRQSVPVSVAFLGMDGNWDLVNAATPDKRLTLTSNLDLRSAAALGLGDSGIDPGVTSALSHLDTTLRTELGWQATDSVRLWAAGTAYLPVGDIAAYYLTGGRPLGAPVTLFGEVGADAKVGQFEGSASVYVPVQTRTNLYADQAQMQLTGAYRLGPDAAVVAGVSSPVAKPGLQSAWLGAYYKGVTLSAGVQDGLDHHPDAQLKLSVDLLHAF